MHATGSPARQKCTLQLSDGGVFEGELIGAPVRAAGELVFTTGMVGYSEAMTLVALPDIIQQTGIVGQFGAQNALVLDYLLRLQGSSNPNVIRSAPTADDTPVFAGTNLTPAGAVTRINDQFVNLLPQTVQGIDLALLYNVRTGIGRFDVAINAARLTKFSRDTPPAVQALFDARNAGQINAATPLTDATDLLEEQVDCLVRGLAGIGRSALQRKIGTDDERTAATGTSATSSQSQCTGDSQSANLD